MPFQFAAKITDVLEGQIREFQVNGKAVAIACISGKFFAISSICLHHGGPLGEGQLEGNFVSCPWHGWQYDVTSGRLIGQDSEGVLCYAVEERGNELYVDIG